MAFGRREDGERIARAVYVRKTFAKTSGVQETLNSWTCGEGSDVVMGATTGQVSRNRVMKGLPSLRRSLNFTFAEF